MLKMLYLIMNIQYKYTVRSNVNIRYCQSIFDFGIKVINSADSLGFIPDTNNIAVKAQRCTVWLIKSLVVSVSVSYNSINMISICAKEA
jgi:hypothetical protein